MVRGVIFDCDGVLFESRAANLAYYNAVLVRFNEPPVLKEEKERAHLCHTAASPRVFEVLLGPQRRDEALALAAEIDFRQFIPQMTPEPHLHEAIAALARRYPLAVATNRGNSMHEILDCFNLTGFFSAVVTSRDVPRPKPYPDMLHLASQRLAIAESELLFVGDSELDQAAADTAGMPFVAYRNPALGKASVVGHLELVEWLQRAEGV